MRGCGCGGRGRCVVVVDVGGCDGRRRLWQTFGTAQLFPVFSMKKLCLRKGKTK